MRPALAPAGHFKLGTVRLGVSLLLTVAAVSLVERYVGFAHF